MITKSIVIDRIAKYLWETSQSYADAGLKWDAVVFLSKSIDYSNTNQTRIAVAKQVVDRHVVGATAIVNASGVFKNV